MSGVLIRTSCNNQFRCIFLDARFSQNIIMHMQGRHLKRGGRGAFPPPEFEISDFLCFCTQNLVFFIFCPLPPTWKSVKMLPPWKK